MARPTKSSESSSTPTTSWTERRNSLNKEQERRAASLLASLRFYIDERGGGPAIDEIATNAGKFEMLHLHELEQLYEQLVSHDLHVKVTIENGVVQRAVTDSPFEVVLLIEDNNALVMPVDYEEGDAFD